MPPHYYHSMMHWFSQCWRSTMTLPHHCLPWPHSSWLGCHQCLSSAGCASRSSDWQRGLLRRSVRLHRAATDLSSATVPRCLRSRAWNDGLNLYVLNVKLTTLTEIRAVHMTWWWVMLVRVNTLNLLLVLNDRRVSNMLFWTYLERLLKKLLWGPWVRGHSTHHIISFHN